ncbi:MAG: type II toxin-antitoxin system VapC family toxin [Acidobacteria bacterium]|nr:type II toxin-antitoxin system VapC family toxin [Acidobacteriota bacterium]
MKPKVYLETTIISYLMARPSRDLIVAAHQQITREWWDLRRGEFQLFVSRLVIQEASAGDQEAAQRRLGALDFIPLLDLTVDALSLARDLAHRGVLPDTAIEDALHIAVAAVHGMDYLLTWNCRHIANARMRQAVWATCALRGYEPPVICTPEELMGD